jgi:hypothetical protein
MGVGGQPDNIDSRPISMLGVVTGTYDPRDSRKCEMGASRSRVAWVKSKTLSPK